MDGGFGWFNPIQKLKKKTWLLAGWKSTIVTLIHDSQALLSAKGLWGGGRVWLSGSGGGEGPWKTYFFFTFSMTKETIPSWEQHDWTDWKLKYKSSESLTESWSLPVSSERWMPIASFQHLAKSLLLFYHNMPLLCCFWYCCSFIIMNVFKIDDAIPKNTADDE